MRQSAGGQGLARSIPFGVGLEMESDKPGWCDALNGLPGLFGSSTHEAFALKRWLAFARNAVRGHLSPAGALLCRSRWRAFVRSLDRASWRRPIAATSSPTWQQLATRREAFRAEMRLGIDGDEAALTRAPRCCSSSSAVDRVLARGSREAVDRSRPAGQLLHP